MRARDLERVASNEVEADSLIIPPRWADLSGVTDK